MIKIKKYVKESDSPSLCLSEKKNGSRRGPEMFALSGGIMGSFLFFFTLLCIFPIFYDEYAGLL